MIDLKNVLFIFFNDFRRFILFIEFGVGFRKLNLISDVVYVLVSFRD